MCTTSNGRVLIAAANPTRQPGKLMAYLLKDAKFPGSTAAQLAAAAAAAEAAEAAGKLDGKGTKPPADRGSFPPPLPSSVLEVQSFVAHSTATTCMRISTDGRILFTGGDDGSLCMFEVRDLDTRGLVRLQSSTKEGKAEGANEFSEEILEGKAALVAKKREIDVLTQRVEELRVGNELNLLQKDARFKDRVRDVSDTFQAELENSRAQHQDLALSKKASEADYDHKLLVLRNSNSSELSRRREQYRSKVQSERYRKGALHEERKKQGVDWDAATSKILADQKEELRRLTVEYESKIVLEQASQEAFLSAKKGLLHGWDTAQKRIEDDSDMEVSGVKVKFELKLLSEHELTVNLKAEHTALKKTYQARFKEVKDFDEALKARTAVEHQLRDAVKGLEKDIVGHKKEVPLSPPLMACLIFKFAVPQIAERDEAIAEKEKRIYELKRQNQELEKFKFVLDYKIKELKRQIEPRESEIADMRVQVSSILLVTYAENSLF